METSRPVSGTDAGSVVSEMRQGPMHESCELCLMTGAGFGKGLLELAPRCGRSDPHLTGGHLQTLTMRDGYRRLRFTLGQIEGLPQRLDGGVISAIRIADEDNAARELIAGIWGLQGAYPLERHSDEQEGSQIGAAVDCQETLRPGRH
jgi:hypothetical protein